MTVKKINIAIAMVFLGLTSQAQLTIQSGATFTMQTGSEVTVQGNVDNAGALANEGTLKVQGNYNNTGTYSATAGILEMMGTGNSNFNAGVSSIPNLVINKTNQTDIVKLTASAVVSNSLIHTNGVFTTDPLLNPLFNLSSPATATYTFAAGKEVVGTVKRTSWTSGTTRIFNNPNMQVATNGGSTPTDLSVTMIPLSAGGDPTQNEREVKRSFTFSQTGGSGFTADVRFPYTSTEINTNVEGNLVPWSLVGAEWNARLSPVSRDIANDFVGTTGVTAAELAQEWKLADPNYTFNVTAYIKGGWNNPSGLMRTTINTSGLLPLNQPYSGPPFLYGGLEAVVSIPNANIVDWVLLELRKPASGLAADATVATVIGRRAAFLLNNGTIVNTDGITPAQMIISKQGAGNYVVVRHRNHLAIMSQTKSSNIVGDFANDFSLLASVYQKPGATSAPVSLLSTSAPGNTKYGMWPGDINNSGSVTPSDITPINTAIGGPASGNLNVYNVRDANLDRNVTPADVSVVNSSISAFAQTSSSRVGLINLLSNQNVIKPPKSHVPGESQDHQ